MKPKKLTPLEILHRQKAILQAKSDGLTVSIENNALHLQHNFAPLLRDSLVESAVSKLPPHFRNIAAGVLLKEKKNDVQHLPVGKIASGIAAGITEFAPFFLKGKKGAIFSILLKQVVKWIS